MAGKVIANPIAVLGVNGKELTKGFAAATGSVKSFAGNFASSIGGLAGTVAKFTGIGAVISGVLGGIGMGALVSSQMEAIDVTAKLADRLGASTESIVGLNHAADLAGVSSEALSGGMGKMLKNMADAASGSKVAGAAFAGLGLNAKELVNLPTDEAFGAIAEKLKAIQNPAERAQAAVQIFGKSGQQLLPLLMEGSQGIAAAVKEADALGISFNRVDAAKVEEANDAITRLKDVFKGVATQIAIAISPGIQSVTDAFTSVGIKAVAIVKAYLPPIIGFIGQMVQSFKSFVAPIIAWIQSVLPVVLSMIITNVATSYAFIANVWSGLLSFAIAVFQGLASIVGWAFGSISTQSFSIAKVFNWLKDTITVATQLLGYAIKNWQLIFEIAGLSIAYNVVKIGNQIAYEFTEVIPALLSWFADNWINIFQTLWNFTSSVFVNMAKNVGNFFSGVWSWLKGDGFDFKWTGLLDGFESTIKELPKIAEREAGPLEAALGQELTDAQGKFWDGFSKELQTQSDLADDIKNNIAAPPTVSVPAPAAVNTPGVPAFDATGGSAKAAKTAKTSSNLDTNILSGSAESQALRDAIIGAPGLATADDAKPEVEIPKAIHESADEYQPKLIDAVKMLADRLLPLVERIARSNGEVIEAF